MAPSTQASMTGQAPPACPSMAAGRKKIPEPMMAPTMSVVREKVVSSLRRAGSGAFGSPAASPVTRGRAIRRIKTNWPNRVAPHSANSPAFGESFGQEVAPHQHQAPAHRAALAAVAHHDDVADDAVGDLLPARAEQALAQEASRACAHDHEVVSLRLADEEVHRRGAGSGSDLQVGLGAGRGVVVEQRAAPGVAGLGRLLAFVADVVEERLAAV